MGAHFIGPPYIQYILINPFRQDVFIEQSCWTPSQAGSRSFFLIFTTSADSPKVIRPSSIPATGSIRDKGQGFPTRKFGVQGPVTKSPFAKSERGHRRVYCLTRLPVAETLTSPFVTDLCTPGISIGQTSQKCSRRCPLELTSNRYFLEYFFFTRSVPRKEKVWRESKNTIVPPTACSLFYCRWIDKILKRG